MRKAHKLFMMLLISLLFLSLMPAVSYAGEGIRAHLEFDDNTYRPGDTVYLELNLSNVSEEVKTNSVTFEIEYDSRAFELLTGDSDNSIEDKYIEFTVKEDAHVSKTKRKIVAMYADISQDITLRNNEAVLSCYLKVKEGAAPGDKTFIVNPIIMFDTEFNIYKVNGGQKSFGRVTIEAADENPVTSEEPENENTAEEKIDSDIKTDEFGDTRNAPYRIKSFKKLYEIEKDKILFTYSQSDYPTGLDKKYLKVCYWDSDLKDPSTGKNGIWIAVPTVIDNNTNSGRALVENQENLSLMILPSFPDLEDSSGHWAEKDIYKLISLGIASGDPSGNFRPNDKVSRQEFAKMVVLAAGLKPDADPRLQFTDASRISTWARGYVSAAVKAGIISGYEDNTFQPQKDVTRAELAAMIVRALDNNDSQGELSFIDNNNIPGWARNFVAQAVKLKIVSGYPDGSFRANECASRAQAAKMISKMLDYK